MVSDSGPAGCVRRAGALQLSITVRFPLSMKWSALHFMLSPVTSTRLHLSARSPWRRIQSRRNAT